jgi:hypothetical protein
MLASDLPRTSEKNFKRLVGVRKDTFARMVQIHTQALQENKTHKNYGRPRALTPENEVLLMLTYYREYRTFLSTARIYNIAESSAFRIVKMVEKNLINHSEFHLKGKKSVRNVPRRSVVVDVTECNIERPQKTTKTL